MENIMKLLISKGVPVDNFCNGNGKCGKCKVRIISGEISPLSEEEKHLLSKEEIEGGIRLACLCEGERDVEMEVVQREKEHSILQNGFIPPFQKDFFKDGYGIVLDIGTTTVVMGLIDLKSEKELASTSMMNPQAKFGLDVLSRITYEYQHLDTGVVELQNEIVHAVNAMIEECCVSALVDKKAIKEITVAANCTMMHMLLGIDARTIGKSPYKPAFLDAKKILAKEIGIDVAGDTMLYCLPQVSAYVGADIVAGVYACGLDKRKGKTLFVDIGTNGEIVLSNQGKLLACSCAAGPALEGMNIRSGMRAANGAVENVRIEEDGIKLTIIGNQEPVGICGSGILAVVRELLRTGIVKKTGAFVRKEALSQNDYRYPMIGLDGAKREFVLHENPKLVVTQSDIRQVQLAKGALASGITALLQRENIDIYEFDRIFIAGQFGAHLPEELLTGTGILPQGIEDKLEYVGNTSKTGAYMALMSEKVKFEMENLARKIHFLELAELDNYDRVFASNMIFPSYR